MIFKDCYWGSLTLIPVAHYMPWNKKNINLRCKGINTFFNQNLNQCFRFIDFCIKPTWYNLQHYHMEVQANHPKNGTKKPMLFLASMGEAGLSHDIFFKFSRGPFDWQSLLNFEAATSKFCNCSWKLGSSPRKGKVNLCMTNGSKVLIYLTLLDFLLHYSLDSIKNTVLGPNRQY